MNEGVKLYIGAKPKIYFCGGWGGKVLGMITGGLIGGNREVAEPKQVQAPTTVHTGNDATQAEIDARRRNRRGYQSTVGAGSNTGGGTTQARGILGG